MKTAGQDSNKGKKLMPYYPNASRNRPKETVRPPFPSPAPPPVLARAFEIARGCQPHALFRPNSISFVVCLSDGESDREALPDAGDLQVGPSC